MSLEAKLLTLFGELTDDAGPAQYAACAARLLAPLMEAAQEHARVHASYCRANCGPEGEGWLEHEKCDCSARVLLNEIRRIT